MEKTIKIGKKSVKLNNNIGWTLAYRDQFGRDVIPAIMPMFASAMDIISGIVAETGKVEKVSVEDGKVEKVTDEDGKVKKVTVEDIMKVIDGDSLIDAVIHLGGLEIVDFINIVWALAKCADEGIPEPSEWVKEFDEFPLDVIAPEVIKLVAKGVISSKNLERLKNLTKTIQPLNSTPSSSQDSNEA